MWLILSIIKKAIANPFLIVSHALSRFKIFRLVPDRIYLQIQYYLRMGQKLNLKDPKTYNEKLQWIKLYDRKPEYTLLVDKYEVRKFVVKTIGEEYLIPLLGVYGNYDEIEFDSLPNQFVLKPNHTSGDIYICKDKSEIDHPQLKKTIGRWLKREHYWTGREWSYKDVKPRIVCEKYMMDETGYGLKDYKFLCFNGEPKILYVVTDQGIDARLDFFDLEFNHLPIAHAYKNAVKDIGKPKGFKQMIGLSKLLSKDFAHIRVDFYDIAGKIYFGELTFYNYSGLLKFEPEDYDRIIGSWLSLPVSN